MARAGKTTGIGRDEDQWWTSLDVNRMIGHVCTCQGAARTSVGRCRLRLFCASCLRLLGDKQSPSSRQCVEMLEWLANGLVSQAEFVQRLPEMVVIGHGQLLASMYQRSPAQAAALTASYVAYAGGEAQDRELSQQAATLMREIFGNPFRPVTMTPASRGSLAVSLAQAVYAERLLPLGHLDSKRLAVLANAMEEAGLTNQAILDHLRGPGPHVRGCWAVDLILCKQ